MRVEYSQHGRGCLVGRERMNRLRQSKCVRRYPFDNIPNFRDLGGYAAGPDGMTRWGVFYRCGRLSHATSAEIEAIKAMGIRTIIDLRMEGEVKDWPDACQHDPDIHWRHLSLMGGMPVDEKEIRRNPDVIPTMSTLYRLMLDHSRAQFQSLFALLAEGVRRGAVLFHCLAGKDRTGLTAMFLQAICGVDRLDMVAHYEVSKTYNMQFWPEDTTGSDPQNLLDVLDHLDEAYGGPAGYLRHAGVPEEAMETIRRALYEPNA